MRGVQDLRPIDLHLVFTNGGLGDSIARLASVRYAANNFHHLTEIRLFVQDYFVDLAAHLLNHPKVKVYGYSRLEEITEKNPKTPGKVTDNNHHTTLRTHLTDHAFHTLIDTVPEGINDKDYPRIRPEKIMLSHKIPEAGKFVVITTGFTAFVRELLPQYVNEITAHCIKRGYQVVFLGREENVYHIGKALSTKTEFRIGDIDYSVGVDLRDKTTLLEAAKIMGQAACVVGLDNGLLHLAATTDVPIVAGYTSVDPIHRVPYRHGILGWNVVEVLPPTSLGCRFCQTQMAFVYNTDHRRCYYGDYMCVLETTSKKYIKALDQVLPIGAPA